MRILMITLVGCVALSSCTGHPMKKLPVCGNAQYRYANPNGTILPSLGIPKPQSAQAVVTPVQPAPAPAINPTAPTPSLSKPALAPSPVKAAPVDHRTFLQRLFGIKPKQVGAADHHYYASC